MPIKSINVKVSLMCRRNLFCLFCKRFLVFFTYLVLGWFFFSFFSSCIISIWDDITLKIQNTEENLQLPGWLGRTDLFFSCPRSTDLGQDWEKIYFVTWQELQLPMCFYCIILGNHTNKHNTNQKYLPQTNAVN